MKKGYDMTMETKDMSLEFWAFVHKFLSDDVVSMDYECTRLDSLIDNERMLRSDWKQLEYTFGDRWQEGSSCDLLIRFDSDARYMHNDLEVVTDDAGNEFTTWSIDKLEIKLNWPGHGEMCYTRAESITEFYSTMAKLAGKLHDAIVEHFPHGVTVMHFSVEEKLGLKIHNTKSTIKGMLSGMNSSLSKTKKWPRIVPVPTESAKLNDLVVGTYDIDLGENHIYTVSVGSCDGSVYEGHVLFVSKKSA